MNRFDDIRNDGDSCDDAGKNRYNKCMDDDAENNGY